MPEGAPFEAVTNLEVAERQLLEASKEMDVDDFQSVLTKIDHLTVFKAAMPTKVDMTGDSLK